MFFQSDSHALRFLEAFSYTEGGGVNRVNGRNYCALSFRREATDTVFETAEGKLSVRTGDLLFVPARLGYVRRTARDSVFVAYFQLFGEDYAALESFSPAEPEKYAALFNRLLCIYEEGGADSRLMGSAILYEILASVCLEKASEAPVSADYLKIRPACERIRSGYCDPSISVAELATLCGMSEVCFRKIFEREFGMPPRRYITDLRIQKAIAMLSSPYYSLSEIAEKTGFCDAKYFGTVFRRSTGMTPAKFSVSPCRMDARGT